ncbi:MAG: ribose 5-phosphate isomerase B [Clostridiales bacterium]|jgi:ribose 5-phosphate isomerase B|nr:ribose 5-phosphate isomerase B [Clostridiales bacterium]
MQIYIGSDHGGFNLKTKIIDHLTAINLEFTDLGCYDTNSVDYPDIAKKVADNVQNNSNALGILVCGTGIGMSMAANKFKGIRAALISDAFSATMAKQHNNANIICFGERVIGEQLALYCLDAFLNATFEERHQARLNKLDQ